MVVERRIVKPAMRWVKFFVQSVEFHQIKRAQAVAVALVGGLCVLSVKGIESVVIVVVVDIHIVQIVHNKKTPPISSGVS